MNTELSIIIVNWNGGSLLTRCVETIVSSAPRVTYEVVIIDNASSDDSLAELQKSEAGARLISNQQLRIFNNSENKGFGAANNQGFELTDSPFVFLLNLDTEVHPGTIDTLMRTIHVRPGDRRLRTEAPESGRIVTNQCVRQPAARLAHDPFAVETLLPAAATDSR